MPVYMPLKSLGWYRRRKHCKDEECQQEDPQLHVAFVASSIPAFMWVNEVVTSLKTVQLMMRISRRSADMRFGFRDDQRI
jgi:hypothetical protein